MGVIFSATHVELEHRVAIKVIRPELSHDDDVASRFLNEARASAQLVSDHIARVIDAGRSSSGTPYLAMEYLHGSDLGNVIDQRGAIPAHEAASYILQTCEALAVAHAAGIVHRDIKPENLFVTKDAADRPLVKVLDFGISKRLLAEPTGGLTQPGTSLGSPEYMAPEQMAGQDVDARTDIWSLGVVLFELLTGRRPFDGHTVAEVCAAVLRDDTPVPSQLKPDIEPALDAIVKRCLEKNPAERYATVAELARELEAFSIAEPTPSERAAAALGLKPLVRSPARSLSEVGLRPVVLSSPPVSARRFVPKRAAMVVAAVSSCLLLAAGLASATVFESPTRHTAGLRGAAGAILPDLKALAGGWLTAPVLGPDVPLDAPAPGHSAAVSLGPLLLPFGPVALEEPSRETAAAPAPPRSQFRRARHAARGSRPPSSVVRERYRKWLREEGLTPLRDLRAAESGSPMPGAEVALSTPPALPSASPDAPAPETAAAAP